MPVLVDGNNLLFATRKVEDPDRLLGRSGLCHALGDWAARTGERVHVVFDGPRPTRDLVRQIRHPSINLTFSGAGRSADAVLIQMIEADSAARRLVVVSSDREIMRAAKRRKARPVKSDEFWISVRNDLAKEPPQRLEPEEKRHGLEPTDTERWLREFGLSDDGAAEGP